VTAHEVVITLGRPFDITANTFSVYDVREVRVPFADQQSAEAAAAEVVVSVRAVHDAGGEDYRPVVPGEVVKDPADIKLGSFTVVKCRNCGYPVSRSGNSARRSPTGWAHWGFWQGIRCPGAVTGAVPGGEFTEDEYLAWVDERIKDRTRPPAPIEDGGRG
jgi:hypothetical protein